MRLCSISTMRLLTILITYFVQCFSQAVNITSHYCPETRVEHGGSVTLTCSRVCGEGITSKWRLERLRSDDIPDTFGVNPPERIPFIEGKYHVTLNLSTDDSCADGETIQYSLTIGNANENINQVNVTCGVRIDDDNPWNTTASPTTIFITVDITPHYCETGVEHGGSVTLTCSRVCGQGITSKWRLERLRSNDSDTFSVNFPQIITSIEEKYHVTLNLSTDDSCADGETIQYSLTIGNANENINQVKVTCGVRIGNHNLWSTTASPTTIFIAPTDTFQPQIATNTKFEIKRPPESNISLNCTRACGLHIYDTWSFSLGNETDVIINSDRSGLTETLGVNFNSDVKLTLCNHDDYEGCDGKMIEYSLDIHNVTMNLTGLIVTCGAMNNNTSEQWTASHSVQLIIEEDLEERAAELNETVLELNETVLELNGTVRELNGTVRELNGTVMQQSDELTRLRAATGVLSTIVIILIIFIIAVLIKYRQEIKDIIKRIKKNSVRGQEQEEVIANRVEKDS